MFAMKDSLIIILLLTVSLFSCNNDTSDDTNDRQEAISTGHPHSTASTIITDEDTSNTSPGTVCSFIIDSATMIYSEGVESLVSDLRLLEREDIVVERDNTEQISDIESHFRERRVIWIYVRDNISWASSILVTDNPNIGSVGLWVEMLAGDLGCEPASIIEEYEILYERHDGVEFSTLPSGLILRAVNVNGVDVVIYPTTEVGTMIVFGISERSVSIWKSRSE